MDNAENKMKRFFKSISQTFALFILIALLCYVLFKLSNDFGPIFDIKILTVSIALALVFLTFMYVTKTNEIINESVIERKKTFIEKKIEKLYAPLISNKNLLLLTHENLNQIKTYQHLASDVLKPLLKEYIELFDNEEKNVTKVSKERGEAIYLIHIDPDFQEKIRAQIHEDYDGLIEELYNIHK
jgi:hypothetical protein